MSLMDGVGKVAGQAEPRSWREEGMQIQKRTIRVPIQSED